MTKKVSPIKNKISNGVNEHTYFVKIYLLHRAQKVQVEVVV